MSVSINEPLSSWSTCAASIASTASEGTLHSPTNYDKRRLSLVSFSDITLREPEQGIAENPFTYQLRAQDREVEKMDVSQTMQQLVELFASIEELKKRKATLFNLALDSNPSDAADVFLNNCLATKMLLLNDIRQLEQVIDGTYGVEPMEDLFRERSNTQPLIASQLPQTSISNNSGGVIFCVGGRRPWPWSLNLGHLLPNQSSRVLEAYDSKGNKWIKLREMKERRTSMGMVATKEKLYAIGGSNGEKSLSSVEMYTPKSGTWQRVASMNGPAREFGVAHTTGTIYVIGGWDHYTKAEKYDIGLNRWTQLSDLTIPRIGVGCAVLDEVLYAIGGSPSWRPNSCERHDPYLDTWEEIASMSQNRSHMGVCVLDGFLYAVGGAVDNNKSLASVERYDPETDIWTPVADMSCPRTFIKSNGSPTDPAKPGHWPTTPFRLGSMGFLTSSINCFVIDHVAVAVMDGLIYAIGGTNGYKKLKSVEVYSPALNKWSNVADLNESCYGAGAAWVDCSLDLVLHAYKKNRQKEK